jgi:hypothetical protein
MCAKPFVGGQSLAFLTVRWRQVVGVLSYLTEVEANVFEPFLAPSC